MTEHKCRHIGSDFGRQEEGPVKGKSFQTRQ